MTTATDNTIHLTPEQAGMLRTTIQSHLLDLGLGDDLQLRDDLGIDDELNAEHVKNSGHLGAKLTVCARVLERAEQRELPIDEEVLELLADCEREAARELEADQGGHPNDIAISEERLAMTRVILGVAGRREGGA